MRVKRSTIFIGLTAILLIVILASMAVAEDGEIFRRNISKTPDAETEKAAIFMMDFYVPAQMADGTLVAEDEEGIGELVYCLDDGETGDGSSGEVECTIPAEDFADRHYAKPLLSVYIDDIGHEEESLEMDSILGGMSFGQFDTFIGISLDDGDTWRSENLSRSADLSSFTLANGHEYPGDVHHVVHQVAEDKVLAVWASRYCQSGFPLYSLISDLEDGVAETTAYLADLEETYGKNALYLYDLFGVAGPQGSVDYTEQGYPEVGEIPYSCIWAARGKLLPGDDPMTEDVTEASHLVWMAPERLTSGVRDANLPAVDCAGGAGCALTWQEDPEGLRPGKGLGPGEGWSGAIANAKTDIWYSYISFADFDLVVNDDGDQMSEPGEAILLEEYEALKLDEMDRPKPYVPMAIPVRLTDNDMCRAQASNTGQGTEDPYCWIDFDTIDDWDHATVVDNLEGLTEPEPEADFCLTDVLWTNPGGTQIPICVTEDGRWMIGRVASTRVRMVLKPYAPAGAVDQDGDGVVEKSAWLSLAAEETKALGLTGDTDGDMKADIDPVDIGKDMFYYTFDYTKPYNLHMNTALDAEDSSPYIVQQGGMLNQPASCSPYLITTADSNPDATCPADGEFFDIQVDLITGYEYYLTEIARRFALTQNSISNITDPAVEENEGLSGILIYKQGIIWQGGPADIMLRRTLVQPFCEKDAEGQYIDSPECFDPAVDNPFAFENMECVDENGESAWLHPADVTGQYPVNPNYLQGLCMAPAINISGSTIAACTTGTGNEDCASDFPAAEDGSIPDDLPFDQFPKVLEWRQCDGVTAIDGCENSVDTTGDLDDQSWENPYDVAKGHRGFLYGDYVMMMYAWSPNWNANSVGNDHYNLYQRRSFDGGITWTTTPSDWCDAYGNCGAGLDALEYYYGETVGEFVPYVWTYGPGEFEQARNLSLLHGNKVTILDPRYSPAGGLKQYPTIRTDWLEANSDLIVVSYDDVLPYPDDAAIDPSKYYLVYETGDNTTVTEGEAVPLDLFYSRATVFGDNLEWFDYVNDDKDCNPVPGEPIDWSTCVEPRWPWLENAAEDLSGEASVVMNPGGTFVYNVWNQWREEILPDGHELIYDSDIWFRRLLYLPDDSTVETVPTATILYVSHTAADYEDEITFMGTGRDIDRLGDGTLEYEWSTNLGLTTDSITSTDGNAVFCTSQACKKPGWAFVPGFHTISFKVKDDEGVWSTEKTFSIFIAEELHQVYLPATVK